ncbi:Bifunctional (p)ppGpp synthase/hydrolase RelA [Candidatus Ornithobacterium hominis]|uniref:Bifunctional (P)ppGpp synthase/hydrolase RelA n=1 Tax=Candidatus Ornithobacterium hominis TaxID=2497989 RepID=A0A383TZC6_9FLAO|nr:bifunctional (p)ppGpp synthetase/guanosine-3',5'-bis(diphosphate) 3'-pyrophosphohydrolase [Candidatus Ornithobacterium hominis]MCT7904291.1 bifunctional (p)ppGpp synthetase/guanosine-3',5'-bis(diphosphate) 3'-pyrophosphohydrolase [Candidatus Ornithobacterium hominis]SZD72955.1 Bifunctional (p)ppGpp synthase/hydrolase RelA [Candidatus Ornithobacterium hominis]
MQNEIEKYEIARRYKDMLRNTYRKLSDEDKDLIRKAFDLAADAHKEQRRKSGEPYIFHPISVAQIVADEIGLGATSIACALMHDVVEDTEYTLADIERLFGNKIAKIIDGLTKISVLNNQELSIQSENFRKLLLTLSEDIRVIIIKIADRLHNMRTLGSMPEKKQLKIASETTFIYAPLAHRMGLYNIKSELEDLSLKYTNPKDYFDIARQLEDTQKERRKYIQEFSDKISNVLNQEGLSYEIKGRPKSINSIYRKMNSQNISFDEVYDKFAIRIIYKSEPKDEKFIAWKIYSIITDIYSPNPRRLRDWIIQPKSTGYESLHITVMGPGGKWVEVQIRSERMDEIAEKGIAAHYKYKENYKVEENKVDRWINQVREILENQDNQETSEFIDNFKLNLYSKEIYVFTPQGDVISLPKGSSPLDFAYAIHTNVGDSCLGAKINGKLYPLSHELNSGDQVEIITSQNQKPKMDWLDYVKTGRAKTKIKASLNAEKRLISEEGKEILTRKLRSLKLNLDESLVNDLQTFFNEKNSQNLFLHVQNGVITNQDLKRFADKRTGVAGFLNRFRQKTNAKKKEINVKKGDILVFGEEEKKLDYTLANCCNPILGDDVFGFITVNRGVKVHKKNCSNAVELRANYSYRILKAQWVDGEKQEFETDILIKGIDRKGLVKDITDFLSSNANIEMKGLNFKSIDGVFEGNISMIIDNKSHLEKIIHGISHIDSVRKVKRSN